MNDERGKEVTRVLTYIMKSINISRNLYCMIRYHFSFYIIGKIDGMLFFSTDMGRKSKIRERRKLYKEKYIEMLLLHPDVIFMKML